MAHFLYIIKSSEYVKVGITYDLDKRLRQLQTGNPNVLRVAHSFKFDSDYDAKRVESLFHKRYDDYRENGEWFNLTIEEAVSIVYTLAKELKIDFFKKSLPPLPPLRDEPTNTFAPKIRATQQKKVALPVFRIPKLQMKLSSAVWRWSVDLFGASVGGRAWSVLLLRLLLKWSLLSVALMVLFYAFGLEITFWLIHLLALAVYWMFSALWLTLTNW